VASPSTASQQPPLANTGPVHYPANADEAAKTIGGTADEWSPVGSNGWAYRNKQGGTGALSFTVPSGCLVDTPAGRFNPGEQITATDFTIYWV